MGDVNREFSRRELFGLIVPHEVLKTSGRVELDVAKCSACGLCTRECSSGAISMTGSQSVSLVFRQGLCDACGRCVEICPEQCLKVSRIVPDLSRGPEQENAGPVVLFEDGIATCPTCGAVIGSKAMIERVRAKLQVKDPALAARLQLCPVCKGRNSESVIRKQE
jgi:ferredoxin